MLSIPIISSSSFLALLLTFYGMLVLMAVKTSLLKDLDK